METRANYILIGCFTLAVILGAFGFVYWFHHVGGTGERMTYRVMFQGPVGGLRSGASVTSPTRMPLNVTEAPARNPPTGPWNMTR